MWRGGCIIRSAFLGKIKEAYEVNPELPNLLLAPYFVETIQKCESAWRQVVSQAALLGVPTPAFSTARPERDPFWRDHMQNRLLPDATMWSLDGRIEKMAEGILQCEAEGVVFCSLSAHLFPAKSREASEFE